MPDAAIIDHIRAMMRERQAEGDAYAPATVAKPVAQ